MNPDKSYVSTVSSVERAGNRSGEADGRAQLLPRLEWEALRLDVWPEQKTCSLFCEKENKTLATTIKSKLEIVP